ncbi:hypothetical protein Q0O91_13650, partial [Staphylococcus aureus]|nr:hypothetical protein [Staphylococcus aureus]
PPTKMDQKTFCQILSNYQASLLIWVVSDEKKSFLLRSETQSFLSTRQPRHKAWTTSENGPKHFLSNLIELSSPAPYLGCI